MCHPTTGDLLRGRAYRVLPGLCVRGGLRARRDVFDLYRRVQGGGQGCRAADDSQAFARSARTMGTHPQGLIREEFRPSEQQQGAGRVESRRSAQSAPPEFPCRTKNLMPFVTPFPVSAGQYRAMPLRPRDAGLPSLQAVAEPCSAHRACSPFEPDFRRELQSVADDEHTSTGTNCTNAYEEITQTSVIVLVTSSGNVTVRAN